MQTCKELVYACTLLINVIQDSYDDCFTITVCFLCFFCKFEEKEVGTFNRPAIVSNCIHMGGGGGGGGGCAKAV